MVEKEEKVLEVNFTEPHLFCDGDGKTHYITAQKITGRERFVEHDGVVYSVMPQSGLMVAVKESMDEVKHLQDQFSKHRDEIITHSVPPMPKSEFREKVDELCKSPIHRIL